MIYENIYIIMTLGEGHIQLKRMPPVSISEKSPWGEKGAKCEAHTKKGLRRPYAPKPLLSLVPEVGIEPTWSCPRGILSTLT